MITTDYNLHLLIWQSPKKKELTKEQKIADNKTEKKNQAKFLWKPDKLGKPRIKHSKKSFWVALKEGSRR